jgi:hypothetical protein
LIYHLLSNVSNPTVPTRLWLWATLATASVCAQQPVHTLHGRVLAADSRKPLAAATLTFQPQEPHSVVLLQGWIGAGPARTATTDAHGRFRLRCDGPGSLLVEHHDGFGALVHRVFPNTFQTVQARPMGELVIPGGADAVTHILAVSPTGHTTRFGHRQGPRIRLPAGEYRLLVRSDRWIEFRCRVISGQREVLPPVVAGHRTLGLYEGFRGRITLKGWPRVALPTVAGAVKVPDGPGPRILQIWEERQGAVLLRELWLQQVGQTLSPQTLAPSSRELRGLQVQDTSGKPVAGAWCFSCYQGSGGLRIVSRCRSNHRGQARIADVAKQPTGFVLVHKPGFALGHVEVFGSQYPVTLRLAPGYPIRLVVLGPKAPAQVGVDVRLQPTTAPWAACGSFTNAKGQVSFKDLPLGEARVRLLGTPFLIEEHTVLVARTLTPTTIQARPGFKIHGRVLLPAGRPGANALVMVRQPRGGLGLGERVACTGPDGSFTFYGLPEDLPLVLTASLDQDGRTFTSKALGVEAPTLDLRVQLLAEDRPQPGKRKRHR